MEGCVPRNLYVILAAVRNIGRQQAGKAFVRLFASGCAGTDQWTFLRVTQQRLALAEQEDCRKVEEQT